MYILRMPQIQHFLNFIMEDHWLDFVNDYVSRNEFQAKFSWHARYLQK